MLEVSGVQVLSIRLVRLTNAYHHIEQKIYRYDKLAGADDWDSNAITPGE